MTIRRRHRLLLGTLVIPAAVLAALMLAFSGSTGRAGDKTIKGGKFALSGGDPDATSATKPGLGVDAAEAYLSAERTYPANVIPTSVVQNAEATFNKISGQNDPRGLAGKFGHWDQYGPRENAIQPGVLSFSGATTPTASRITALVISPKCTPGQCRLWAGVAGGGVWRTNNALAPNPKRTSLAMRIASS